MNESIKLYQMNIMLLGDSQVGKSSLIERYFQNKFSDSSLSTIGIDTKYKEYLFDNSKVRMSFIDTAGQERFNSINSHLIKKVSGVIFVYAVNDKQSFDKIRFWIDYVKEIIEDFTQIIVGNKKDFEGDKRKVTYEMGEDLAKTFECKFLETSAKTGENVAECFEEFSKMTFENKIKKSLEESYTSNISSINLSSEQTNESTNHHKCCIKKKEKILYDNLSRSSSSFI